MQGDRSGFRPRSVLPDPGPQAAAQLCFTPPTTAQQWKRRWSQQLHGLSPQKMRGLLTTQSQNCYKEQIQKEMLTRLAWKSRYAKLYPSTDSLQNSTESMQLPLLPPGTRTPEKQNFPPQPPSLAPTVAKVQPAPPLVKPTSPQSRKIHPQDSSHPQGNGRSLHLQRRGHIRPEEKFNFPLLSSWEYGWRLGDYTLDYRTPSHARSAVVEKTFYSKNGVLRNPTATDSMS
ncbi:hypothetical protein FQA47_005282 [Oryzias melastigma]|uniref:Sperm microtubule inner protein 1 C-terminal domain-containing protein n=1 Tax=Oryzias melastigma TaxID=30732 RepID=A0A834CH36_ORYME|nr:hypothetical protein FQA47_005282 [Oryzias melastigma]